MRTSRLVHRNARLLKVLFSCGLLIVLCGCATNSNAPRREQRGISEAEERRLGELNYAAYQQAQGGAYDTEGAVRAYVQKVAEKLWRVSDRPDLPYAIVVVNDSVPNAWALPGGKLAVSRGLLATLQSESELAAVLAHEIVHVSARHAMKNVAPGASTQPAALDAGSVLQDSDYGPIVEEGSGVIAGLTSRAYSRRDELQADKYGMAYLSRAGYDLQAAITLQEQLFTQTGEQHQRWLAGWLRAHPPSLERLMVSCASVPHYPVGGAMGRAVYTNALAGLLRTRPAYAKFDAGCLALQRRDAAQALALAQEALALEPREARFHGLAAQAQALRQAWDQAHTNLNLAIALNNRFYAFFVCRGVVNRARGDPSAARADLEKSLTLLPTATARYHLGSMDLENGATARAVMHFRAAAVSPSDDGRKAAVLLAQLDLSEHPERYLQVVYALAADGYLVLDVKNASPVDVGSCVLGVATLAAPGWESLPIPQGVPARRSSRVTTRLGPYTSLAQAQDSVQVRFEKVAVAGSKPLAEARESLSR